MKNKVSPPWGSKSLAPNLLQLAEGNRNVPTCSKESSAKKNISFWRPGVEVAAGPQESED